QAVMVKPSNVIKEIKPKILNVFFIEKPPVSAHTSKVIYLKFNCEIHKGGKIIVPLNGIISHIP
ncbi:MAG: hypothetical protein FWD13_13335, partial [Treponema sp.]|nr:hypothetical protein [Treponema sp.]